MELYSGELYFPKTYSDKISYMPLNKNIECDVVIVGAGISGAMMSYYFGNEDLDVVLVEKNSIASGSTSASTLLLQYEIDTNLYKLKDKVGEENAAKSFLACKEAMYDIERIVKDYNIDCDFKLTPSMYLGKGITDMVKLKKELEARKNIGIEVDFLNRKSLRNEYGIKKYTTGIISKDGAILNPYKFTKQLIEKLNHSGKISVYENTNIIDVKSREDKIVLKTNINTIKAKKAIFCTGYKSFDFIPNSEKVKFDNTYVAVTNKLKDNPIEDKIIWDIKRPYLYMRPTADGRIVVGGMDDKFRSDFSRRNKLVRKKKKLVKEVEKIFNLDNINAEYGYVGTFATTKDGLGFIGEHKKLKNAYYVLDFGGNGMLYGAIAGKVLTDLYYGRENKDYEVFKFGR